jgi:hypothetical protein
MRHEAVEEQVDRALAVGVGGGAAGTLQPGGDEVGTPPRALGAASSHGLNASTRDAGGASGGLNASGLNASMRGASGGLNASLRAGVSAPTGGGAEPEMLNPEPAGSEAAHEQQPEPAAPAPPQLPAAGADDEELAPLAPPPPLAPRAPPPVNPDDPWSAIQSKYSDVRSPGAAVAAPLPPRPKRVPEGSDDDEDDVVMLEGPNPRAYAREMAMSSSVFEGPGGRSVRARGSNGGGDPRSSNGGGGGGGARVSNGGWGDGALAANGTLMLGGEPVPGARQSKAPSKAHKAREADARGGPVAKTDDLGVEDMEDMDLDALINQDEADGGLNADLAAKLRAFEEMGDDDE